jgi:hypothetical protein
MASDDYNWMSASMDKAEPQDQEKALRDTFVAEYLVDYDAKAAAMRCGFAHSFAEDYAKKFMNETYVQRKLKEVQLEVPVGHSAQTEEDDIIKRKIKMALVREAHNPYTSGAARVAALSRLAVIYGMDQPAKSQDALHRGGVMMVPAIADLSNWESAAVVSQEKLVYEARS